MSWRPQVRLSTIFVVMFVVASGAWWHTERAALHRRIDELEQRVDAPPQWVTTTYRPVPVTSYVTTRSIDAKTIVRMPKPTEGTDESTDGR